MSGFTILGLRVVRAAVRYGSFSTAAENLGYTQSAVSRQIALMEKAAGVALFDRQARGVQPTEAGRIVAQHAETVLNELNTTEQSLRELGSPSSRRLRVGAYSTAMAALVPVAIAEYATREPSTRIKLREGLSAALLASVVSGRLDMAIVTEPQREPAGIDLTPLLEDELYLAMPVNHRLAGRRSVTGEELRGERWISGAANPADGLLGIWNQSTEQLNIDFIVRDWVSKIGLVMAGLGLAVVPGLMVPSLPEGVAVAQIGETSAKRVTLAATPATAEGEERCREFLITLRESAIEVGLGAARRLRNTRYSRRM
ncbi:LysR family transcriptional regulator [Amycolatopsis sp. QT-25]|uniref:LysR family transcriptional regulator n=1 Tax=Amycolatopsis sp. QT-25 TaxID=3034022 RepID=UPI0023ED53E9|nr:LysR family transcriptional regulator [Amycolatopsis sp. QT-25]WET82489.1 LysR family transcriptional regulator [Amycolatopsis sp. QT-25]